MEIDFNSWAQLITRWFHVMVGITWIGQTFLFNWLERRFEPPKNTPENSNISGELWMVHSGGFFHVQKQSKPELMPSTLHWFKWESALTWLSGLLLFVLVYYQGGLLLDYESEMSNTIAIAISIGTLVGSWIVYNIIWRLPFSKNEIIGGALSYLAIVVTIIALGNLFSARAVYMHVGAMFGSIMVANVWERIIPAQRQMLAALDAGEEPDMSLGKWAAQGSKHNTYLSIPLVMIMLSNHYPTIGYGNDHAVVVLSGLIAVGWVAAKIVRG